MVLLYDIIDNISCARLANPDSVNFLWFRVVTKPWLLRSLEISHWHKVHSNVTVNRHSGVFVIHALKPFKDIDDKLKCPCPFTLYCVFAEAMVTLSMIDCVSLTITWIVADAVSASPGW